MLRRTRRRVESVSVGALILFAEIMTEEPEGETPRLQPCLRCKVAYRLVGIEATEKPHHHLYTFECPSCGHIETRTVRVE